MLEVNVALGEGGNNVVTGSKASLDDNACLQGSPGWGPGYTCASSRRWCISYGKDMQRVSAFTQHAYSF
jgi:hypothetical protein